MSEVPTSVARLPRYLDCTFLVFVLCGCNTSYAFVAEDSGGGDQNEKQVKKPALKKTLEKLELNDINGTQHTLRDFADARLVVFAFVGTECPLAKLYAPRLQKLYESYRGRGVAFFAVSSNCQDSVLELRAYAKRHGIEFPLLKDLGNKFADKVGATRTPEVFVLDKKRAIRYHGRIDDQYGVGYSKERPLRADLEEAINELLAGKEVSVPVTEPPGCFIGRLPQPKQDAEVTYSKQIARIFQKHCIECHRSGEIAPFELTDYEEIVGWAETISEVIEDGRMPPWHANPSHGEFKNARLMSDEEKQLVYKWVEDGTPRGDPADLPKPRAFLTGWRLPRDPDQVIAMRDRAFRVPAEGIVDYQYFVVDPGFKKDTWVSAAEVVPGNRSVVHHAIVFIRPPDPAKQRGFGLLNAYVPGQGALILPKGQARRIPTGSKLIFQMHYTPNGSPQEDITRVGLIHADPKDVRDEVLTLVALNRKFEIPPGAKDYIVRSKPRWLPKDGRIISFAPHMHLRGKSFRYVAKRGAKEEILLDVPHYDFNWQHGYMLTKPLPLAEVDSIECVARFDNSKGNLVNPDPTASVRWGDQSWQEMMIGFFDVAIPKSKVSEITRSTDESDAVKRNRDARTQARRFMDRFDKNSDDLVHRDEVPKAFRAFAFDRFDVDRDGALSMKEIVEASRKITSRRQQSNAMRRRAVRDQ